MSRRPLETATKLVVIATAAALFGVTACSKDITDNKKPTTGASDGGSSEQYTVQDYDAGPVPASFAYDTVAEPWGIAEDAGVPALTAACKAFDIPDAGGLHTAAPANVRDCECDNCLQLVHQCDALQGCREMRQCTQDVGCSDPYTCYLTPTTTPAHPAGCTPIFDKWGNTGLSTYLVNSLNTCATGANCPTP